MSNINGVECYHSYMSNIPNPIVDQYIQANVTADLLPIVESFRSLVRRDFPELIEDMRGGSDKYPGSPIYRLKRIVVVVNPTKNFITFAFSDGKSFDDTYGLLKGVGNKSSNWRIKKIEEYDGQIMSYYLRQGIAIDASR